MKTADEIYQEMLDGFGARTGLEPREGCDLSARLYVLAAQVCALYIQADWVIRQAFPQTAEGEYLDFHAKLRGLERKKPVAAEGTARFTVEEACDVPRSIPRGTVCMTTGLVRFETAEDAVLEAGELSVDVPIRALEAGAAGNVSAGTIVSMAVAPMGVAACVNPQACAGGVDGEKDEDLRERILDSFKRLPNGANAAFYEQEALSFDQVAAATVISRPRGIGSVDVIPASLNGVPDQALLERLQAHFEKRREIAVDLVVRAPETITVNIQILVEQEDGRNGEEVRNRVEAAVRGWFTGKLLGQDILRARLGHLIYSCDGVANYVIAAPSADVSVAKDQLPVLGTLSVEAMV